MNNFDRGMIKWLPFNSVVNTKEMIKSIEKEKNKHTKPDLSEEQINILEKKIYEAWFENSLITVIYYENGQYLKINSKIKKIDSTYHKIYFNVKTIIFEQIINIF